MKSSSTACSVHDELIDSKIQFNHLLGENVCFAATHPAVSLHYAKSEASIENGIERETFKNVLNVAIIIMMIMIINDCDVNNKVFCLQEETSECRSYLQDKKMFGQ